jgi:hypothetical protein
MEWQSAARGDARSIPADDSQGRFPRSAAVTKKVIDDIAGWELITGPLSWPDVLPALIPDR